jgi:5-methylcytosine-specific restriction endonuclease McrA
MKNDRSHYHAARHAAKSLDPEYRRLLAARSAAYRIAHPEKTSELNAKRRAADPEKARRESREWFAKNPDKRAAYEQNRRAKKRERGGKLSPSIVTTLMVLQRGKCACCRVDLLTTKTHLDHVMPLALGGRNEDLNMQLLCADCNQEKHAKHPIEFMQKKGFLL